MFLIFQYKQGYGELILLTEDGFMLTTESGDLLIY